jgi:hypothetical protein
VEIACYERALDFALLELVIVVPVIIVLVQDVAQLFAVASARKRRVCAIVYERLLVFIFVLVETRSGGRSGLVLVLVTEELVHSGGVVAAIGVDMSVLVVVLGEIGKRE